jgi:membrane protein DedA with SNARE-associated domain
MSAIVQHGLADIGPYVTAYGALALFVILYFESFGAPLPGETALITASLLAAAGELSVVSVFISAWFAAVLGDSTGYAIGRYGGRPLLEKYGSKVKLTPERLDWIEGLFRARGAFIVITARFVVILRQLNGLVAGSMLMPWHKFVAANIVGAAVWVSVWCLGPYYFADMFRRWL